MNLGGGGRDKLQDKDIYFELGGGGMDKLQDKDISFGLGVGTNYRTRTYLLN